MLAQIFSEFLVAKVALEGSVGFVIIDIVVVGTEVEKFAGLVRRGNRDLYYNFRDRSLHAVHDRNCDRLVKIVLD